jgi:hypothetical protein
MQKSTKVKIAVGTAAAVAVAGGGAAIAASQVWSPKAENQAVLDDAAKQLGVPSSELTAALKKALEDRVDAAVQAGRLTKAQGDVLKARIEAGDAPLVLGGFGPGGFGHVGPFGGDKLDAAASYLGLTEDQLRTKLESGKTLAQVAKDEGKTVDGLVQAMLKDANAKIDAAVADGKLTKSQGDELKGGLEQQITDLVNGSFRPGEHFRGGFHPWFGPGFRPGGDFRSRDGFRFGSGPTA